MARPGIPTFSILLTLVLLISTPVYAGPYSTAQLETLNYNLDIIMSGVNFYYSDNGSMPASVAELLQSGWIPGTLRNPISDGPFDYYAADVTGGEIIVFRTDNNQCIVKCLSPMDTESEFPISSSDVDPRIPSGADLRMDSYQIWLQESLFWYWNLFHEVPSSIDDMTNAGVWPFDGSEVNPYTYEPLIFSGLNAGEIYFAASDSVIRFTVHYDNNVVGCASLDKEQIQHIYHF